MNIFVYSFSPIFCQYHLFIYVNWITCCSYLPPSYCSFSASDKVIAQQTEQILFHNCILLWNSFMFSNCLPQQAVILPQYKAFIKTKIEIWELALRVMVSHSSSATVSFQELQEPTYCTEEKSNICGMNNLSVGEAFSFLRLISSHLLPLNIRL